MLFIIESIIFCILFSIGILLPLAKNPVGQIMSFPVEIRRRVESLPQYKDSIKKKEKRHIWIKILGTFTFVIILAVTAFFSGATTFKEVFLYVFLLFFVVNMYDLFIMDIGIFMQWNINWIISCISSCYIYSDNTYRSYMKTPRDGVEDCKF